MKKSKENKDEEISNYLKEKHGDKLREYETLVVGFCGKYNVPLSEFNQFFERAMVLFLSMGFGKK